MNTYNYKPKSKRKLISIIKKRIRGKGDFCNLNDIDISLITDMSGLFTDDDLRMFDGDISEWNTENVKCMRRMFYGSRFNGDISKWKVNNVINTKAMFANSMFNGDISTWDVRKVEVMDEMFCGSKKFNRDISNWDVVNVKSMRWMFANSQFDQPIGNWDVSNVSNFSHMFFESIFNQDIGNWNVSNAVSMSYMFANSAFNKDICKWNLNHRTIKSLAYMFSCSSFRGNIEEWRIVQSSTSISNMFESGKNNNLMTDSARRFCINNSLSLELVEEGVGDDYIYIAEKLDGVGEDILRAIIGYVVPLALLFLVAKCCF